MSAHAPTPATRHQIKVVASAQEWSQAHHLIVEYLGWVRARMNVEPFEIQPQLRAELDDLPATYTPPRGRLLLATVDGWPAGVIGVVVDPEGWAEMKRLYVTHAARGRGLGELLVRAALATAADLGCATLRLESFPGVMDDAIALYRRLGFRPTASLGHTAFPVVVSLERPVQRLAPTD